MLVPMMQENQHAMDLIAKLDLEKAQLLRARDSGSSTIAAKSLSPGKSLFKAFGQDSDSTIVAELQSQLEQEKVQRQQVICATKVFACWTNALVTRSLGLLSSRAGACLVKVMTWLPLTTAEMLCVTLVCLCSKSCLPTKIYFVQAERDFNDLVESVEAMQLGTGVGEGGGHSG